MTTCTVNANGMAALVVINCCCCCWCHSQQEAKRGLGSSAVFIARNRFAVLDKASGMLQVRIEVL